MYDVLVIGGGPAGYLSAERAAQGGLSVALFEEKSLGGTCLNVGCIPSKSFLNSAKLYDHARYSAAFGVTTSGAMLDHRQVVARKNQVVKTLVGGVGAALKKQKVTVVKERAYITGKQDGVFTVEAGGKPYEGKHLILALGSSPVLPPIEGLHESVAAGFAHSNESIFDLKELPKTLVVVGGGVIGMEIASYFQSGGSQVHVFELLPAVGGPLDEELARQLKAAYEAKGVLFHLGAKVTRVKDGIVVYEYGDTEKTLKADKVLLSVGRRANIEGVGLDTLGVLVQDGHIAVDRQMQTNVPKVYAPGDVNGAMMLAHVAYRQAEVAVNHILGKADAMHYRAVPSVLYTSPEIACVGETEQGAKAKGYDIACAKLPMQYSGRYVAENEGNDGYCKLVYDKKRNRLLGAQILGNGASEIIFGVSALIDLELPLERIKTLIFPHPTVGEIIRETMFDL